MSIAKNDVHTVDLSASECWTLIRSVPVGRLAVSVDGHPDIFPVNHVVDHGTVVLRTGPGTKQSAASGHLVAFEVDGYDAQRAEAWSVVVKGVVRMVERLHEVVDALQLPLFPWQDGPKPSFLRIEPDTISGRRIRVTDGHTTTGRTTA